MIAPSRHLHESRAGRAGFGSSNLVPTIPCHSLGAVVGPTCQRRRSNTTRGIPSASQRLTLARRISTATASSSRCDRVDPPAPSKTTG